MHQIFEKLHRVFRAMEHFSMNEWTYRCDNLLLLDRAVRKSYQKYAYLQEEAQALRKASLTTTGGQLTSLSSATDPYDSEDRDSPAFSYYQVNGLKKTGEALGYSPLPMDMGEFEWRDYLEGYVLGVRKYLLKEKPETIPDARKTLFL